MGMTAKVGCNSCVVGKFSAGGQGQSEKSVCVDCQRGSAVLWQVPYPVQENVQRASSAAQVGQQHVIHVGAAITWISVACLLAPCAWQGSTRAAARALHAHGVLSESIQNTLDPQGVIHVTRSPTWQPLQIQRQQASMNASAGKGFATKKVDALCAMKWV